MDVLKFNTLPVDARPRENLFPTPPFNEEITRAIEESKAHETLDTLVKNREKNIDVSKMSKTKCS